jgi:hypothetical protein
LDGDGGILVRVEGGSTVPWININLSIQKNKIKIQDARKSQKCRFSTGNSKIRFIARVSGADARTHAGINN